MVMPWQETDISKERFKFIIDWEKGLFSFSDLCKRYQISRTTGYLLIDRYNKEGMAGLGEKPSAPHHIPHKTSDEIVQKILDLKYRFPKWGPDKIRLYAIADGLNNFPATSTIGEILKRHGLVKPRKKRKRIVPHTEPLKHCIHANAVWSIDFKGQFRLKDKSYCYPLTVTDNYSRFLFACDAYQSPNLKNTLKTMEKVFNEFGLPDAIRSDNGQPFCGLGIAGLTQLSIWFIKLGITVERINLGCPQENGRHERMHRTLKEATIIPYESTFSEQQKKFNDFIYEYNFLRPHAGIEGKRPNEVYRRSKKPFPEKLPAIVYPNNFLIRKVKHNGQIKFAGKTYFISELLHREPIGLEMIDDDRAIIYFNKVTLGLIDSKLNKIIRPY